MKILDFHEEGQFRFDITSKSQFDYFGVNSINVKLEKSLNEINAFYHLAVSNNLKLLSLCKSDADYELISQTSLKKMK